MRNAYITFLLIATGILILVAALMALLIGLVLPDNILVEEEPAQQSVRDTAFLAQFRSNVNRSYGTISDYNWLVSINFLRYHDIPTSLEFACSGVIISRNKFLTTTACFRGGFSAEDFHSATVRSQSSHFSHGGQTHSVRSMQKSQDTLNSPYNEVYLIEVKPSFSSKTNIPLLITTQGSQVLFETMSEGGVLVMTGWGGPQIPTERILKYEPFFVQRWYPAEFIDCEGQMCGRLNSNPVTTCCYEAELIQYTSDVTRMNARPLMTIRTVGPPLLIGMQLDKSTPISPTNLDYFVDFGYPRFIEWLKETLPDLMVEEPVTEKQDFERLTLYSKVTLSIGQIDSSTKGRSKRSITQCSENANISKTNNIQIKIV